MKKFGFSGKKIRLDPQRQIFGGDGGMDAETLPGKTDGLHVAEIPHRQDGGQNLPRHGGDGGAHHAPVKAENKHRVQYDVHQRPAQGSGHGKGRAAVLSALIKAHPGNAELYFHVMDEDGQMYVNLISRTMKISVQKEIMTYLKSQPQLSYKIN